MTRISVSVPTERLEQDVRALLGEAAAGRIDLFHWDLSGPAPREHIDLIVPPYTGAQAYAKHLAGVSTSLVQSQSIGYDDVVGRLPAGTRFANAASVHETATSELALALTLAAQRGIPQYVGNQHDGTWRARFTPSLADRRVLVLGFGGVGKATVARLEAFETIITVVASTARDEAGRHVHGIDELDSLLPAADVLILTLPATTETTHIIDDAALALLPDGALVVNVGRGPLIETDALLEHVQRGRVRAALDVTDPEPLPADHPLWRTPGVLITPHVGGAASSMRPRIARLVADQARRLLAGEEPRNVVIDA